MSLVLYDVLFLFVPGVAHKLCNHTTEFGATDAIHVSSDLDLLLTSGYDLDNGLGFINCKIYIYKIL